MGHMVKFFGEDVYVGSIAGIVPQNVGIIDSATAFGVLNLFMDELREQAENAVIYGHEGSTITLAFAYNHFTTQYDGIRWTTWIKIARTNVSITDTDAPPLRYDDVWDGWQIINYFNMDNFTDENYARLAFLGDLHRNVIYFYELAAEFYPYWNGSNVFSLNQITNGGKNFLIALTLPTEVHGNDSAFPPTRMRYNTNTTPNSWTNYEANGIDTYVPTYTFTDYIGLGAYAADYIYSPFDIDEAILVKNFVEDTASEETGLNTSYGHEGGNVDYSSPISLDVIDTGLISMYTCSNPSMIRALASFLWSSGFIDNILKAWTEPFDSIISFGTLPVNLDGAAATTASNVYIGNVDTGIQLYRMKQQRIEFTLGEVEILENFGGALDYEPFTAAKMYIPFIGFVPMKINEIMAAQAVGLKYNLDCLSGDFVAQVKITKQETKYQHTLSSVLYEYQGNCLTRYPLTGRDFSTFYKNLVSGGFNMIGAAAGGASGAGALMSGIGGATDAIMEGPDVQRSGAYTGSGAAMSEREAYIVITRPNQQLPPDYGKYVGFPTFDTFKLGDLSGFTMVESVIDNTVAATDAEKAEIERLLKEGVYL